MKDSDLAPVDGDKFWNAVNEEWGINAPTERNVVHSHNGLLAPITGYQWRDQDDFPEREISYGYFHYADDIDWEAGSLRIGSIFPNEVLPEYFNDDDLMIEEETERRSLVLLVGI